MNFCRSCRSLLEVTLTRGRSQIWHLVLRLLCAHKDITCFNELTVKLICELFDLCFEMHSPGGGLHFCRRSRLFSAGLGVSPQQWKTDPIWIYLLVWQAGWQSTRVLYIHSLQEFHQYQISVSWPLLQILPLCQWCQSAMKWSGCA